MSLRLNRRDFTNMGISSAILGAIAVTGSNAYASSGDLVKYLAKLQETSGGTLGFAIIDRKTGKISGLNLNKRFGMCSTFKLVLAAIVMNRIKNGELDKNQMVKLDATDLKIYSPDVQKNISTGEMNIIDACRAAQLYSDNVAANGVIHAIGGVSVFTNEMVKLGDKFTRLDRIEPSMNLVKADDVRDTTTPSAMAKTLNIMLSADYLGAEYYETLFNWMIETGTGKRRLRAGLPSEYVVGDKTGTGISKGMPNKYNDVALIKLKDGQEYIITSYFESDKYYEDIRPEDEGVLARAAEFATKYIIAKA